MSADFVGTFPDYYQTHAGARRNRQVRFWRRCRWSFLAAPTARSSGQSITRRQPTATSEAGSSISTSPRTPPLSRSCRTRMRHSTAPFSLGSDSGRDRLLFRLEPAGNLCGAIRERAEFLNQGTHEPATVSVFHRGQELSAVPVPADYGLAVSVDSLQAPGNVEAISTSFKPGQAHHRRYQPAGEFSFHVLDQ